MPEGRITTLLRRIRVYIQLAPSIFWLTVFLILPLGILVLYSVWDMIGPHLVPTWTLKHYIDIFTAGNGVYLKLFFKSIGMSVAVTLGSLALAYPVAYYIAMWGGKNQYMWLSLLMAPFFISWVIIVFGWKMIIGYNGLVNYLLMKIGLIQEPINDKEVNYKKIYWL